MRRHPRLVLAVPVAALLAGALLVSTAVAPVALAQAASAPPGVAAIVKARQNHMKALGAATKALGEQLRSATPDKAVVKLQADRIAAASRALGGWFPAGSGPAPGLRTDARPIVWTDAAGFAEVRTKMIAAAAALAAAAATPDQAGVPGAARDLVAACKGCHVKYRVPDKS